MTNLIIGDIHNKSEIAEKIINEYDCPTILLGDYFDDFDDTIYDIQKTAEWLKESLSKPNRIHLVGNHDFHYMVKPKGITYCSGFSTEKYEKINEILTAEDWDKLKFFHHEKETYWFSHAGITKHWFEHPLLGLNLSSILKIVEEATKAMKASDLQYCGALWAADRYRGGRCSKGGLLWNDWRNCEYFEGVTQIFGHTPVEQIGCVEKNGGININIDTHLTQVLELDTDKNSWNIKTI